MYLVSAKDIGALWVNTFRAIQREGTKLSGIQEIPNLMLELTEHFDPPPAFDKAFRTAFGDERIDYASSVTFVPPKKTLNGYAYRQNDATAKWTASYWGRMIGFGDEVNQIEAAIKKLSNGKNTKMISIAVYDPRSDSKKVMGGVPCLTALDVKPRSRKIDLTAFMRSMRFTKSGYADVIALCRLGQYLAKRSNMELGSVSILATSGHIFYSGPEYQNSLKLLKALGAKAKLRK